MLTNSVVRFGGSGGRLVLASTWLVEFLLQKVQCVLFLARAMKVSAASWLSCGYSVALMFVCVKGVKSVLLKSLCDIGYRHDVGVFSCFSVSVAP